MIQAVTERPAFMHEAGSQPLGQYRLIESLRDDGLVAVWLGHDPASGQYLALTLLPDRLLEDPGFRQAFHESMQRWARIEHPNILPLLDHGVARQPYAVTRFIAGGNLAQHIRIRGGLAREEMAQAAAQIGMALDEAHHQGVMHHSLDPYCILRTASGWQISDFGLAQMLPGGSDLREQDLPYAAPERFLRVPLTHAADIYAFGVLLYQMAAGELPYHFTSYTQWMAAHLHRSVPGLSEIRPDLPAAIHSVIERAMAKLPHLRYASAGEAAQAFIEALYPEGDAPVALARRNAPPQPSMQMGRPALSVLRAPGVGRRDSPSRLYADALMAEIDDPLRALSLYQRIIDLHPQLAQGEVIQRLSRLEAEIGRSSREDLLGEAARLLIRGDWGGVEHLARRILGYDPQDVQAQELLDEALPFTIAADHYRAARLAALAGAWPEAHQLLGELYERYPRQADSAGLLRIGAGLAPQLRMVQHMQQHRGQVLSLAFSPDSQLLASGSTDRRAMLWSTQEGEARGAVQEQASWVCFTGFNPGGDRLFCATWEGEIRLWSLPEIRYSGMIAGLSNQLRDMAFGGEDQRLMATAAGYFLTLWRMPEGRRLATLRESDREPVTAIEFAPEQPLLICGTNHGRVRLREMRAPDYRVVRDYEVHGGPIYTLAISANGALIGSGSRDGTACIIGAQSGEKLLTVGGGLGAVRSVAFSADGEVFATAARDGVARLWRVSDGELLRELSVPGHAIRVLAFSPDGRSLATGCQSGAVQLWRAV